ncbi:MAG: response regulator [Jatrophihabitans sp.]
MNDIRVVVADDQAAVREGLVTMLGLQPDIEVVAAAASGAEVVDLVTRLSPDVILMDLHMPDQDGLQATRQIMAADPAAKIVVLTTLADDASVLQALRCGALAYLTKDAGRADIARALHAAAAGHTVLDANVQARVLSLATEHPQAASPPEPGSAAAESARQDPVPSATDRPPCCELPDALTAREADVLRLIAGGLVNADIARTLVLSENTVKTHVNHLFAKIGAADRAQAVIYAYRRGFVDGPHS